MSVAFATVFLGLVLGTHPVELTVGADVARVELLLDGQVVGQRSEPPWKIPCDFGTDLAPHELVAVARNAEGTPVGRTRQWVNFPRSGNARAKVSLDPISTVLDRTPIAIDVGRRGRDLDARALAGRLVADGRPVDVAAVEKGAAEVVVVMDPAARNGFLDMIGLLPAGTAVGRPITEEPVHPGSVTSRPRLRDFVGRGGETAVGATDRRRQRLKTDMRLEERQLLRFLWPFEEQREGEEADALEIDEVRPSLFDHSRGLSPSYGGVLWLLSVTNHPIFPPEEQRLADAVAVAGLTTAVTGRRRAVVLILSENPSDASRLSPPAVRGYLRELGVPLYVWAVGPVPDEVGEAWGGVRPLPKKRALGRAVKELSRRLERQRIVWIDGLYLPQQVAFAGSGGDLRLVR